MSKRPLSRTLWQSFLGLVVCCAVLAPQGVSAQQPVLRFGDATGSHGETVEVEVFGSFDVPVIGVTIPFTFDADRLEFVTHDFRGTPTEEIKPGSVLSRVSEPGKGIFAFNSFEGNELDPGADVLLARLKFRILLGASGGSTPVVPVLAGPHGSANASFYTSSASIPVDVQELVPGAVEVVDCGCPLTVDNLSCEQFLDRVLLAFTPSEVYDEIEIRKTDRDSDYEVIAVLAGDASNFEDVLDTPIVADTVLYSVTARHGGASSVRATCEVTTRGASPSAVSDLACTGGSLTWTNPEVDYDLLLLYKNGDLLAELPGDAVAYVDGEFSDELTIYTLIGQLEGYRSAEINCLQNAVTIFEVGDVQVPLNAERFSVPIYVTNSIPAQAVSIGLDVDVTRLRLVTDTQLSIRESDAPTPEAVFLGYNPAGVPAAAVLYQAIGESPPLQPGLRQRVFNFFFEVTGEFADGETIPLTVSRDEVYNSFHGTDGTAVPADLLIDGRLTFGSTGLEGVVDLQGEFGRGDGGAAARGLHKGAPSDSYRNVSLSWENGEVYDTIWIERDGKLLVELDGSATEFRDEDVDAGFFIYKVIGTRDDVSTFPVSSTVVTVTPPGSFVRGDVDDNGVRNVTDVISILRFLFLGDEQISCRDSADVNDNGALEVGDPITFLVYLFLGGAIIPPPGTSWPWLDPTPDDISCGD